MCRVRRQTIVTTTTTTITSCWCDVCIQMRSASRSRVRVTSISFLRRWRSVWPTSLPLLRLIVPRSFLLANCTRSVQSVPDVMDRRRGHWDGLPIVARRCRTLSDGSRLWTATSTGSRWWRRFVCPSCRRSAMAVVRETRNLHTHWRLRCHPRYIWFYSLLTNLYWMSFDVYLYVNIFHLMFN